MKRRPPARSATGCSRSPAPGATRGGGQKLIGARVAMPPEQSRVIAEYSGKNFPERDQPKAVVVPGSANVAIKEWVVPSLGSPPHDPLAARDGSLWWTGQWANVLGRLDVKSGTMKEFPLKTPQSGPHGLTEDANGAIWYTGNSAAHVGKLDPKTGVVTEYPMPDKSARDPHTLRFDKKGRLWFTLQGANMVGRLDPQTGDIKLVTMPAERSLPYGMVLSSTGVPFLVEFGTNKVASLDPESMAIKE